MIEDSLKNRKHVVNYDTNIIPTEHEIEEILRTAYPLCTSKQKAFPYKWYVLGPNKIRSERRWNIAEGNKINIDHEAYGTTTNSKEYVSNPGLFHMRSAPWTLIVTPRTSKPNLFYKARFETTGSKWELLSRTFVDKNNRESCAIEIGMLAKAITGVVLDRGWDTSYNICFLRDLKNWKEHFPFLEYVPALVQTIGKGSKYLYEAYPMIPNMRETNTNPPFEDIFSFVDRSQ